MEQEIFIAGQDYFTANNQAFFRVIAVKDDAVAAKLYKKDPETGEYEYLETGIYPNEIVDEALEWDDEEDFIIYFDCDEEE